MWEGNKSQAGSLESILDGAKQILGCSYTTFTRSTVIQHGTVRYDYNRAGARSHCAKSNRTESLIDN